MKVHLITIGDEILIGQIVDTNSAWMAQQLNLMGARVVGIDSVADDMANIQQAITRGMATADVVLITGGLGPTKDDVTKKAIADFVGDELVFHEPTYQRILRFFEKLGRSTTDAHRQQCFMPSQAKLLLNKMGTAPGMWIAHEGRILVSMPGVPYEMKYLMTEEVIPRLREALPALPIAHRTILTAGEGESRIALRIQEVEASLPAHIKLAYLPNLGQVRLRLSGILENEEQLNTELDHFAEAIRKTIPELIFGEGEQKLQAVIGDMLKEKGMTLCTAESCTGGYLAHLITSIPGSSAYFMGSVIAYHNKVKEQQLGVKKETLEAYGAVSEQVVREMVKGAASLLETDIAVAISGIAGPGGGTPAKPVGTIWMAVGNDKQVWTRKLQAGKNRLKNIEYSASHALNFIRQFLLDT
jgi:nicotinamide-nucleotide amidase